MRLAELVEHGPHEVAPHRHDVVALVEDHRADARVAQRVHARHGARRLVLPPKQPFETPYLVDLRRQNPGERLAAPFFTLTSPKGAMVRVMAEPRFRKAEFLVSMYATSSALLRPGDVVDVDAGPAGRVRARLTV